MSFFTIPDEEIKDPLYRTIKKREYFRDIDYHDYIEKLFERTKQFLDDKLHKKASRHFHAHFWEMYLCDVLLSQNNNIVQRTNRKYQESKGPDILVQNKNQKIWIEAVTVGAGKENNKVTFKKDEQAPSVPDELIKLRLTSSLHTKEKIFADYLEQGIIDKKDLTIIALNGKNVPLSVTDNTIPRIVRCLFGIGDLTYSFDKSSGNFTNSFYQEDSFTQNPNEEEVRFDSFLTDQYSHISGIIYSRVDIFNMPDIVGNDLMIVHNPKANNQLKSDIICVGQKFYLEGDELKNHCYY